MFDETRLLYLAAALYVAAAGLAWMRARRGRWALGALGAALAIHGTAIGMRWARLDHGPFVNLFEILSSNVWSLHLAAFAAATISPLARRALAYILIPLQILTLWLLTTPATDSPLPVTYATPWLPVHIALGKIFLGLVVIAVGFSLIVAGRRFLGVRARFLPASDLLDEAAYRLMLVAVVFESLMLVAGAAWAQDAWGRYWAWDPLEIWAFATWTCVVAYLHWRAAYRPRPELSAVIVLAIFIVAFTTFFGVPFLSTAPHKGAI